MVILFLSQSYGGDNFYNISLTPLDLFFFSPQIERGEFGRSALLSSSKEEL